MNYVKSLEIYDVEKLRGEVIQTWQLFTIGNKKNRGKVYTWTEAEKSLINLRFNESEFVNDKAAYIQNFK